MRLLGMVVKLMTGICQKSKKSKNAKSGKQMHIGATKEPTFLTPGAREVFNQLKQALTKALIL